MNFDLSSYRKSFFIALGLHVSLALLLVIDSFIQHPAAMIEAKSNQEAAPMAQTQQPSDQVVKAVSVNSQEIMETVNHLKEERAAQLKAEQARQQELMQQAKKAQQARIQEQQRLEKLKKETEQLAIARKKQIEEEQRRLEQLAMQKARESARLKELKLKHQEELQEVTELQKKHTEEKAKDELRQAQKEKAEQAEKNQQAAQQAAMDAAKNARMAGEVDKYKAMIVNAIGRKWILPDNVNNHLSSQFRIRLAPNGTVLEVNLTRSSGDAILDRSAQTAIYKASPLPVPTDPGTFNLFRDISLTVRPENIRG